MSEAKKLIKQMKNNVFEFRTPSFGTRVSDEFRTKTKKNEQTTVFVIVHVFYMFVGLGGFDSVLFQEHQQYRSSAPSRAGRVIAIIHCGSPPHVPQRSGLCTVLVGMVESL